METLSDAENDAYFRTRVWQKQLGAWASQQSQPVASRQALCAAVAREARRFGIPYEGPGIGGTGTDFRASTAAAELGRLPSYARYGGTVGRGRIPHSRPRVLDPHPRAGTGRPGTLERDPLTALAPPFRSCGAKSRTKHCRTSPWRRRRISDCSREQPIGQLTRRSASVQQSAATADETHPTQAHRPPSIAAHCFATAEMPAKWRAPRLRQGLNPSVGIPHAFVSDSRGFSASCFQRARKSAYPEICTRGLYCRSKKSRRKSISVDIKPASGIP